MMLPIQARTLLVPLANIAEMAAVAPIFPDNSGPNWFLGYYNWRNQRVPLSALSVWSPARAAVLTPTAASPYSTIPAYTRR